MVGLGSRRIEDECAELAAVLRGCRLSSEDVETIHSFRASAPAAWH
jgi:hypothetical protein